MMSHERSNLVEVALLGTKLENDELKAHINLLREVVSLFVETYMPGRETGINSISMPDEIVAGCLVLSKTPPQSLNSIRAPLQKENDKLKAHVEQLREVLFRYAGEFRIGKQAAQILMKTPSQSLNHIKAQVEEETIRESFIDGYYEGAGDDAWYRDHDEDGNLKGEASVHRSLKEHMETTERKYK